jgi:uncharacterized protein YxeA
MKKNVTYLLILLALLLAGFLAWDAINRRPLRVEQKRQFVVQKQDLADEPDTLTS